jgi:hypothetical protein
MFGGCEILYCEWIDYLNVVRKPPEIFVSASDGRIVLNGDRRDVSVHYDVTGQILLDQYSGIDLPMIAGWSDLRYKRMTKQVI